MKFTPKNRHLLVERVKRDDKNENTNILLPEDYKQPGEYTLLKVLDSSLDCSLLVKKGEKVIVATHLVQDIEVGEYKPSIAVRQTYSIVLENHVLGVLSSK